mmetsp:Transcript_427/g.1091  ORF Transcript_427/g.1091 Transcript_427/m.1091 type:complete len:125 (-) Transcript_427:404-778(-)
MGNIAASQCKDSGFGPGAVLWENQAFVKSTKFPYKNAKDCVCATEGTCEGYGDLVLGPYSKTKCSDGKSFSCSTANNPNIKSDVSTCNIAVPWSKKGSDDYKKNSAGKWFRPASKSPSRRDEVG